VISGHLDLFFSRDAYHALLCVPCAPHDAHGAPLHAQPDAQRDLPLHAHLDVPGCLDVPGIHRSKQRPRQPTGSIEPCLIV